MRLLKSPKPFLVLGAVVLAVLAALAIREGYVRVAARRIPPYAANLTPEQRQVLQEKVTRFTAEVARNPTSFSAYVELALALADLGDREGAAEVYRTMNQRFAGNFLSYQNLGKLYEDAGQHTMAAEQYLLAIQNAPRNPHLYRNIVDLYTYHLKDRASDIPRILQQGLGQAPGSVDLMAMLAVYYRDHGDPTEAIKWYELLLVHDQANTTALEELKALKEQVRK